MTSPIAADAWTLLAVAEAGDAGLSPVQLQKAIFLLSRRAPEAASAPGGFYAFEPYDYGPFSPAVYSDAERFALMGLITIGPSLRAPQRRYAVTEGGRAEAARIAKDAPPGALAYLRRVIEWIKPLNFNQLVRAIYAEFPEMRENSVFRG